MIINGREVSQRSELTDEEIKALPDDHPLKAENSFTYAGIKLVFDPEREKEILEFEQKQAEEAEKRRKQKLLEHYRNESLSGVFPRYWDESLDTYKPQSDTERKHVEVLRRFVKNGAKGHGTTVILCGENGNGKTLLLSALIREMGGRYLTATRLLYEIESTMSFSSKQTKIQYLDQLVREPMLVIDEVGKGERIELQKDLIAFIYNERYSRYLPTGFGSNLSKDDFINFVGRDVVDRLNETCAFLEFSSKSYRPEKRKADIKQKGA